MSRAQKQVTDWCFTIHGHENVPEFDDTKMKYMIVGKEVGEEKNTPHYQCFGIWKRSVRLTAAKGHIKQPTAHMEERKGTREEARDYCKKENDWKEFGKWEEVEGKQGKRTDIEDMADLIKQGKKVEELLLENSNNVRIYARATRTFDKLEDIVRRQQKKTWITKIIWITGSTGTGKSQTVWKNLRNKAYYRKIFGENETKYWDGYRGEEDVWFDDYRGEIAYNQLMQLADGYPYHVPVRGREPYPWLAKRIWITSVRDPEEVYCKQAERREGLTELNRRMHHIVKVSLDQDVIIPEFDHSTDVIDLSQE